MLATCTNNQLLKWKEVAENPRGDNFNFITSLRQLVVHMYNKRAKDIINELSIAVNDEINTRNGDTNMDKKLESRIARLEKLIKNEGYQSYDIDKVLESNRKLTLDKRIAYLENALKASRTSHRKFEGGPVNDNLLALAKELKARLRMKKVEPTNVKCYDGEIVVTLDWDYFGIVNFYVTPTARGYHIESDEDDNEDFETLDRVVKYFADRDYEAAMDL